MRTKIAIACLIALLVGVLTASVAATTGGSRPAAEPPREPATEAAAPTCQESPRMTAGGTSLEPMLPLELCYKKFCWDAGTACILEETQNCGQGNKCRYQQQGDANCIAPDPLPPMFCYCSI